MDDLTCEALSSAVPPVQRLSGLGEKRLELCIHRLDQCFPASSGNKIYKLFGHFLAAKRAGKNHLLSFGGAWSNHLHALAIFAARHQLRSTALVRGLHVDPHNAMLRDVSRLGMVVRPISKDEYARRRDPEYLQLLQRKYPDAWIIPEGGDDAYGRWGAAALAANLKQSVPFGETLVVASGTGATVRALAMGLGQHSQLVSALVVKDTVLADRLKTLCTINCAGFRLLESSGSGYGRLGADHLNELEQLLQQTGVLLDPLYNGKAWHCAVALAAQGERVHLLHTGGVQGWRGFLQRGMLEKHPSLKQAVKALDFSA